MSESLGLSIGVANLVAARSGDVPVVRTPVLTLFEDRQSEVGLPEENSNLGERGLVLRGFVERVGDPSPLVAADGTKYLGQALTIEALEAMARTVGYGTPITVAVPAYWSQNQVAALRQELFAQPDLGAHGGPPTLVSDATAALTALAAQPGFPTNGVVAVCDFGAGGTSITLANAGSDFEQVGSTVRYSEFSGDDIDQLILSHVLAVAPGADNANVSNTATSMGSVTRMLGACRAAKEQLSATTVATIATGNTGAPQHLSRSDLDELLSAPLDRFIGAIGEVLQRNGVGRLTAVAAVGGGASIPLVASRLSERLQVPVLTGQQPLASAAVGAAAVGSRPSSAGAATRMGPAVNVPTGILGAAAAAGVAGAAGIAGAAGAETMASPTVSTGASATEAFLEGAPQTTEGALAWSEDSGAGNEPVPYAGPADYTGPVDAVAAAGYTAAPQEAYPGEPELPVWYRRPAILLSLFGAAAAILVAVVLALTVGKSDMKSVVTTSQPAPITTSTTGPDGLPTEAVITPPPVVVTTEVPVTTTTTPEPTTTSAAPSTTATTTTQPTTTQATTTQPTTSNPPTTTAPPTTSAAPPTTQRPVPTSAAPAPPTSAAPAG